MGAPDISKLSNDDLRAIATGDMSAVSDYGLRVLSGESTTRPVQQVDDDVLIKAKIGPDLKKSTVNELGRQVGLTARYGLEGVGGFMDLLASPFRGAMNLALPEGSQIQGDTGVALANTLGLPTPEGKGERVVGDITRTMAAGGGSMVLAKAAMPMLSGIAQNVAGMFAANPAMQTVSAGAAGAGSGAARESGAGPWSQAGAGLLAGLSAPVGVATARKIGSSLADIGSLVGAAYGNQRGINRLASDAATTLAGEKSAAIRPALLNATELVPGVKPTVKEAIAQANIGKPYQFGGATVKMQDKLSGASGAEDLLPSTVRSQKAAIETFTEGVEKSLAPVRNSLLRRANKTGVDTAPIIQKIDTILSTPGTREAKMVKSAMPAIKSEIEGLKQSATGIVDAKDIYAIRKNLYASIKQASKESGSWDKKTGAKLEREIQLAIDEAIDSSLGNKQWSQGYMKVYADKTKSVREHQARMDEAKDISKAVKGTSLSDVVRGEAPKFPTLLSRPMMAVNFALKTILGDANTPVAKELARRMADPAEYAKLIALPPTHPTRRLVEQAQELAAQTYMAQQAAAQEEQQ